MDSGFRLNDGVLGDVPPERKSSPGGNKACILLR